MRVNASVNEDAMGMNREMNYRCRSDGVGYMCCEVSEENVHIKVINVVDLKGISAGAEGLHTRAKVRRENDTPQDR